jgi:hypothetical protein
MLLKLAYAWRGLLVTPPVILAAACFWHECENDILIWPLGLLLFLIPRLPGCRPPLAPGLDACLGHGTSTSSAAPSPARGVSRRAAAHACGAERIPPGAAHRVGALEVVFMAHPLKGDIVAHLDLRGELLQRCRELERGASERPGRHERSEA